MWAFSVEDVELATLSWVHWWNHERILEPIGDIPAVEFESSWRDANAIERSSVTDGRSVE